MPFDPTDRRARREIDEAFVAGQIGRPVAETRIDELNRFSVGAMDRTKKRIVAASSELALNSFRNESASVSFQTVDALDEIGAKCDRDSFGGGHDG